MCFWHHLSQEQQISEDLPVTYLRSLKTVPDEQGVAEDDDALLIKGLGTCSGQIAPGSYSRQVELNILPVKQIHVLKKQPVKHQCLCFQKGCIDQL